MPIVSSKVAGQINKPGGRRKLIITHVDHLGKVWDDLRPILEAGDDDAVALAESAALLDADLGNREAQEEAFKARQDGLPYAALYQTEGNLDRKTLAILMQIKDALEFSKTLQWFRTFEVRAGANTNARANWLGVTSTEYGLVATRYNQITGLVDGLNADAGRVWPDGGTW